MTQTQDSKIGERIAALETGVHGMTTAIENLTDKVDKLGDKLGEQVTKEIGHAKENIMQVVNDKAPKDITAHRLKTLEDDMKQKAPNESFKELRGWVIGAVIFILIAFGTSVTGIVYGQQRATVAASESVK